MQWNHNSVARGGAVFALALLVPRSASAASVWPQPASLQLNNASYVPLAQTFTFTANNSAASGSALLSRAFTRYTSLLHNLTEHTDARSVLDPAETHASGAEVQHVYVTLDDAGDDITFGVNESYTLTWDFSNQEAEPILHASTVFGALRGLETFSQLVYDRSLPTSTPLQLPVAGEVIDGPRFPYRGLMMDYSRHFYPVEFIEHTIDAMAASKLNVLHMHITDDQSFPMESASVPELAEQGAFLDRDGKPLTYSADDVDRLTNYAQDRGVLLVPEFDMPAHSSSWRAGRPDIVIFGGAWLDAVFSFCVLCVAQVACATCTFDVAVLRRWLLSHRVRSRRRVKSNAECHIFCNRRFPV